MQSWVFRDLEVKVQQPVLIPRVESEKIIDIALKLLNNL